MMLRRSCQRLIVAAAAASSSSSPLNNYGANCNMGTLYSVSSLHTAPGDKSKFDDALASFDRMLHMNPLPSPIDFNKLLSSLVRMRQFGTVISLCKQMELVGVSPDVFTVGILINCFCNLNRVDFGFSALGKILKLGFQIDIIVFTPLIKGLCRQSRIAQAVDLFDHIVDLGYHPDIYTYSVILNGLCKMGKTHIATGLLKKMAESGCHPNVVAYNTTIHALYKVGFLSEALDVFLEMK